MSASVSFEFSQAARSALLCGRTLESVPLEGEKVYLRGSSNVKLGGVCEDCTDKAHPSAIKIAQRVLAALPGLPFAGVDFMTADKKRDQIYAFWSALCEELVNAGY